MNNPKLPEYIIAIGASAGGMEEINSFFDHTPCDGVSYIIVQHLSPDFKSRMVELVSRHSKLVVKEGENGMQVKENQVYLIPNDKFMTISDDKLYLTPKDKIPGPHLTINRFFNSLAQNSGKAAIAVVLSGLGSDGSEGIKAIKREGGMVIARNPETSEFSSMPSNAIATGAVDLVLEPALMPGAIEDYVKKDGNLPENENDEKNITTIVDLIKEKSPLDFSEYKQSTIFRRIKRRARYNNFKSLENYIEFLKTSHEELDTLSKDFLISVTSFFRNKEAFDILEKDVIPSLVKNLVPGEELKMWVAACATGEEAYSLAILAAEQLKMRLTDTVVKIFATDIDSVALVQAGKGLFPATISKDVSEERLAKYFIREGSNYKIKSEIRNMIIFARHDLVKNPPYCNMHLISCRNLLIYMAPALQKKIFYMLLFGLKIDGYLLLGSSENPMPIIENLEVVDKTWKIYKNLQTSRTVHFDGFAVPQMIDIREKQSLVKNVLQKESFELPEAVNALLVNELDYLVICVDENGQVIKTYGDTSKYLLQKNFNSHLPDLLPGPLNVAFKILSSEVSKTNQKATKNGIKIEQNGQPVQVVISVTPLNVNKRQRKLLMVIFSEDKTENFPSQQVVFDEPIHLDQYTLNLEDELKELKNKLQSTYDQLDRSNDNMQSFNEELLSANEEMQSTNEEMQSVNEELHTINADYVLKNKELTDTNDDLNNYFRSNTNGQLFVNNDLLLMKFSPGTVKLINLRETDIGRPLSHISTNIKFETITRDIKQVIDKGITITKEIETDEGKWYQTLTMPYITGDHKRNGAMITFNDVTELKQIELELDRVNKNLLIVNADLDNFVHAASHDLLGPLTNIELSISMLSGLQLSADPKLQQLVKIINSSFKKFRTLVSELGAIGKIESEISVKEAVDANELIEEIEASIENRIILSGATIRKEVGDTKIYFSKKNLRSIIYNLITNAIKFRNPDVPSEILISAKSENGFSVLTVKDNGIGMRPDDVEKIFSMYGRLNEDIEGQGIGLYLIRKIINAAGGKVLVESEPGKGSSFTIYFVEPLVPAKAANLS
ncbi:MAG TPA: chemotaxis protein CheB [Hanamia sp.]|nr:chemotaxis protein CheB [Hanamia sp.]